MVNPQRFEVYLVNLDPTIGSEIKKTRPALVVSPNEMNDHLSTIIIAQDLDGVDGNSGLGMFNPDGSFFGVYSGFDENDPTQKIFSGPSILREFFEIIQNLTKSPN